MTKREIDPAELESQLSDIKSAMGIEEAYPSQGKLWLAYAAIVAGFSIALQLLFVQPLPEWVYSATWVAFAAISVGALWLLARRTSQAGAPGAPDLWVVVAGLGLTLFALTWIVQPLATTTDAGGVVVGAYFFATVIALAGLGFLLVGNALKAHRIRRRDRWVFYAGGLWMLAFAMLFPNVEFLRYGGYGVFGILSILHALVSYVLLTRT